MDMGLKAAIFPDPCKDTKGVSKSAFSHAGPLRAPCVPPTQSWSRTLVQHVLRIRI